MTEVSGWKVVALSAVQPINEGGQDPQGTPMQLQVTMASTVVRPMSALEFDKAMEFINNSKDSVKDLFKKGKDFYKDHKTAFTRAKSGFKAMQGAGEIVSGILKFLPDKEDPMVKNLAELEANVKALGEKIAENFSEMKNFISEQTFFTNIMSPTSVLTRHMRSCIAHPGKDSKENFRQAYQIVKPLRLQIELNTYLSQKTTNPLRLSMDSEKVKTKATFEKWEDIYCTVMAQFMLLEAFASGLLGTKSETDFDRLIEASSEVLSGIEKWREEYEEDQEYWTEFKNNFEKYVVSYSFMRIGEKVWKIRDQLDKYLTRDAFYICAFRETDWEKDYSYWCPNEKDQIVGAWRRGGCNAFVYRSRKASRLNQDDYNRIRDRSDQCEKLMIGGASLKNIIQNRLVDTKMLEGVGFYCMFGPNCAVEFQQLNHLPEEPGTRANCGPGHKSTYWLKDDKGQDIGYFCLMIAFE